MNYKIFIIFVIIAFLSNNIYSQLGETFDLERPEKYQEKIIGYEKTYTKKYKLPRKFIQNTISHYNFFFNANEKLKSVFLAAKEAHKDTFDLLLSYYPYSLDYTKTLINDLDSVIQKASGGILTHDLRTNWVDNFYLLIGKSYLLQQKYDSAEMTFNYINYEYAPKTKDKERILTGSKENDAANVFSISTKENNSITHKIFQRPPSRNESFLWMIRTHIENNDFGSASGLVQTLKNDPLFPKRLQNDLDEITGYLFYKQNMYDSAAHYLSKSLSMATGKNDKARRSFLAGQLYELSNQPNLASEWYAKSVKHTLDPVMEVYARLNSIKIKKSDDPKIIDENIAALLKMGRKDAYAEYRDIIYYFAGKMEQERKNTDGAINHFLKSTQYSTNNISQKNKSFLALADIAYQLKKYRYASNYYDSLQLSDPALKNVEEITAKKTTLKQLVTYFEIIAIEDSLQQVASMAPNERDEYLKKLLKRLRKEQGLKDDGGSSFGSSNPFANTDNTSLFEETRGEWYFYNTSVKTRGNNEFKRKWGNRPNIDHWRRSSAIGLTNVNNNRVPTTNTSNTTSSGNSILSKKQVSELSIEALNKNLPFTEPELKISNDSIYNALFEMGKLYQYELEDIPMAIETYEAILKRYGNYAKNAMVLYNLQLAYQKAGDLVNAKKIKDLLLKNYKDDPSIKQYNASSKENTDKATKEYDQIYNLFLEGKFGEALAQKKIADSVYGNTNLWTPQLLYIEAVYYTKERKDSLAIQSLDIIMRQYAGSPLVPKAERLKNAVSRRSVIEHELSNLKVTRNEDAPIVIDNTPIKNTKPVIDTSNKKPPLVVVPTPPKNPVITPIVKDSVKTTKPIPAPPSQFPYKLDDTKEHYVIVMLNKVDNIFTNEARNSFIIFNRSTGKTLRIDNMNIDADLKLLIMQPFANAAEALNYTKYAKGKASTDIVPWLTKDKYAILPITEENLQMVIKNKSWDNYMQFLEVTYPGKF